jgi:cytochrome c oxidase cbb3-type subunit III
MPAERHAPPRAASTRPTPVPDSEDRIIHEYDGIREADNLLPRWWLATLYTTVAFSAMYWLSAEAFKTTASPAAAYAEEQARAAVAEAEKLKALGAVDDGNLVAMARNAAASAEGKEVFQKNCANCHGVAGGGGIGPNLTDASFLHGGKPTQIYATIKEGFQKGGMPGWGALIGEQRVRLAAAYVVSIKNTNVPGGKAPQGAPEP